MPQDTTADVTITPYLCCAGAAEALRFYVRVFGAAVRDEIVQPDGRLGHAELVIGRGSVMLADEFPEIDFVRPRPGGTSVMIHAQVPDARAIAARATEAGASMIQALHEDDGALRCKLADPWGHVWLIESAATAHDADGPARRPHSDHRTESGAG
jgi:PhnB protein